MVAGLSPAADHGDDLDDEVEEVSDAAAAALAAAVPPPPTGEAALGQALLLFGDGLGLPMPPVPRGLAGGVRVLAPGFVGTRDDAALDGPDWFLADLAARPRDYLVTGWGGHGLNGGHVHYVLVSGPAAVFVRIPAGGVLGDQDLARARTERAFALCADLVDAAAGPRFPFPAGERLVAVDAGPDDRRLGRVGPRGVVVLEPSEDPLAEMLAVLG